MYSWVSSWFKEEEPIDSKNITRDYNTFNEETVGSISVPIYSSDLSINGNDPIPSNKSTPESDTVGIEIFETYNTGSGKFLPVIQGAVQLQSFAESPLDAQRSCKICKKLYKEKDNSEFACKYHRGKYQASTKFTTIASLKRWTCCYNEIELSEGCTLGRHLEDKRVTGILSSFNVLADENERQNSPSLIRTSNQKYIKPIRTEELKHEIQFTDTLQKLAIQYNVSVQAIRKANKMFGDEIFGKKVLIIPPEETQNR